MIIDEEFEEIQDDFEDNFEEEEEVESVEDLPTAVREDKIFNNRYNTGDGLPDSDEYRMGSGINVSTEYSDAYLKDLYEYEEVLETKFILDTIFKFIQNDPQILRIVEPIDDNFTVGRLKLSREEVNFIFNRINSALDLSKNEMIFYSPIYVLEAISSISSIEYKKLFDMLSTESQELLIIELNKKYHFLDGKMHKKKIH